MPQLSRSLIAKLSGELTEKLKKLVCTIVITSLKQTHNKSKSTLLLLHAFNGKKGAVVEHPFS